MKRSKKDKMDLLFEDFKKFGNKHHISGVILISDKFGGVMFSQNEITKLALIDQAKTEEMYLNKQRDFLTDCWMEDDINGDFKKKKKKEKVGYVG